MKEHSCNLIENQKHLKESLYIVVGGLKPILYVFDDYNNYIVWDRQENIYKPQEIPSAIGEYYCPQSYLEKKFPGENLEPCKYFKEDILQGFCSVLNRLSIGFDVKAPSLWISNTEPSDELIISNTEPSDELIISNTEPSDELIISNTEPSYELISATLPWGDIERDRSQIAAFIIDFEWLPTSIDYSEISKKPENKRQEWQAQWVKMGYRAIHLLSEKYPEIYSFLFTGIRELKDLEQGLSYGASWCFYKQKTHHREPYLLEKGEIKIEDISYISLERHLEEASKTRYGSYQEIPFKNQFKVDINTPIGKKFFKQLKLTPPLDKSPKGKSLLKLIATLFPSGDKVELVKVLTSGKSAAQATFFLKPKNQATRFIKIGSWLSIQREYLAYQQVIQPQLNSYAAAIIRKPVVSPSNGNQIPTGALMYSLAGFPEDYQRLRSLDDLIKQQLSQPTGGDFLISRLQNTLEKVLKPLSHCGTDRSELKTEKRPLWHWLGQTLPPLSGVLIPLELVSAEDLEKPIDNANQSGDRKTRKVNLLQSYIDRGYKEKAAWTLASFELEKQKKTGQENLSPWDDEEKFQNVGKVLLSGWHLLEANAQEGEFAEGSVILAHPDLGIRISLRGRGQDICQRFGATWIRPEMPVEVLACLDKDSREVDKIKRRIVGAALAEKVLPANGNDNFNQLLQQFHQVSDRDLPNPFDYFGDRSSIPYHYTLCAHVGAIHGDFNLQNILFGSEQEQVGWLIDFERSQSQGMVAFDFAKLEVEIWNHHLSPSLINFANLLPDSDEQKHPHYCLLNWALRAAEFEGDSAEFFAAQLAQLNLVASQALILPIGNALKAIAAIRQFALKTCQLDMAELRWALAAYLLNSTKFSHIKPWSSLFAFLASAWHLESVIPQPNYGEYDNIFQQIQLSNRGIVLQREVDGLLIAMQSHPKKS